MPHARNYIVLKLRLQIDKARGKSADADNKRGVELRIFLRLYKRFNIRGVALEDMSAALKKGGK